MIQHQYYLLLTLYSVISGTASLQCYNVPTSEGWATLEDGMFACAALQEGHTHEDLGKNYVRCFQGSAMVLPCPPKLRWDTSISGCNFPENAVCDWPWKESFVSPSGDTSSNASPVTPDIISKDVTPGYWETKPPTKPTENLRPDYAETTEDMEEAQTTLCYGAMTSEGPRNLKHGQRACAPLRSGQSESDLGKQFVTCSFGTMYTQVCQPGLRFDTSTDTCNWPQFATCYLSPDVITGSTSSSEPATTVSPGHKPTHIPITTRRPVTTRGPATTWRPVTPPSRPPPTGPCNINNCKLPNCFCFGDIPSNISPTDMPMFIMLTFDDALTNSLYDAYYRALLVDNDYRLYNPSGCRIKSALYVSHENTDYSKVIAAWEAGNEIGSHTIHHRLPQGDRDSDYPGMIAEIQGLKDEVLKATGNRTLVDSIIGFRAPYLRVAGDVQFDVLRDFGFLYDTSILNINNLQGKRPDWPFTLDFVMRECINPPCPTKPYPGLWEVPLNGWIGDNGQGCSMIDDCNVGVSPWSATEQQWYNFYNRNFQNYFDPVKVPMPIFTHGFLFTNYRNSYPALARWFQDVLGTRKDVWLVTPAQVINWMKNPLTNSEMIAQKWGC